MSPASAVVKRAGLSEPGTLSSIIDVRVQAWLTAHTVLDPRESTSERRRILASQRLLARFSGKNPLYYQILVAGRTGLEPAKPDDKPPES